MAAKNITVKFTFDKATKNTFRYAEDGDPESHKIGSLYVKKSAFGGEQPSKLTITLKAS